MKKTELTPMMKQYMEVKKKYPDTILFYRLGDFYEMFFDDAKIASKELDLVLTGRDCGLEERAPMCGVPFHSVDPYIARLVQRGYKVAICEQLEDPSTAKGIVKRDVIRVTTPGTVLDPMALDETKNNYLCCLYKDEKGAGVCFADVTTGELSSTEFTDQNFMLLLMGELTKFCPSEILVNPEGAQDKKLKSEIAQRCQVIWEEYPDWAFDETEAHKRVRDQFPKLDETSALYTAGYALKAVGALLVYLYETQKTNLIHMNSLRFSHEGDYMELDASTRRNLELTETMRERSKKGSLIWVLDQTKTAMGARQLRKWVEQPLVNCLKIQRRQEAVGALYSDSLLRQEIMNELRSVHDMERILSRIVYENANCRDLIALKESIRSLPKLQGFLGQLSGSMLVKMHSELDLLSDIGQLIQEAIEDDAPISLREGGFIKKGFDEEADRYRDAMENGREWISQMERSEREKTGIAKLKIGYNRVFGYYIEILNSQKEQVPEGYIRKQTLTNCERYITQELKELETTVLEAQEKIVKLEYDLFCKVRDQIAGELRRIQKTAQIVAVLDVLCSLAEVALRSNYVCPRVEVSDQLLIKEGRHPVVEKIQQGHLFVPNDTYLDTRENKIAVITGPNMAGKSTYMRQVALIVLLAQMGSFVPASSAQIGICDKIFTRVGASDDLASGQSTFMVEMNEVSNILKNATPKSLLILDEIGRGTSTYDGLSIAWAVIEYIDKSKKLSSRTLFATHYHELTELENRLDGVKNYCIAVKKRGDDIIFLRKIISGGADRSYGIEVALLAGLPQEVIRRAKDIQKNLVENDINSVSDSRAPSSAEAQEPEMQMGFAAVLEDSIAVEILDVDLSTLTPIEALNKLYQLQTKLKAREN